MNHARVSWAARVTITGKAERSRVIPGTESSDCPIACITPESLVLLDLVRISMTTREAGAALYGTDVRRWPAILFDAVAVVENQIAAEQTLRYELTDARH